MQIITTNVKQYSNFLYNVDNSALSCRFAYLVKFEPNENVMRLWFGIPLEYTIQCNVSAICHENA